jgi:urease accessory protein UreF
LIAFDQQQADESTLKPFARASRRVGQAQLKRLRPLRDQRLLQRYLRAVDETLAHGWHTLVYGVTLSVYSLPVIQGLNSYEKQTLLGFMHAVSRTLRLSEADCRDLLDRLSPSLPHPTEPILGEDENPRTKVSF